MPSEQRVTGRGLYVMYAAALKAQGVEVDKFVHLDAADKAAWRTVARWVRMGGASDSLLVPLADVREMFRVGGGERLEMLTPFGRVVVAPAEPHV